MMHGHGKSDEAVVAMKPANEVERSVEKSVEQRAEAKGNASQQSTFRAQNRGDASQALERIRQRVKKNSALSSHTRGGSRMRESRTYGSVRGALSNERPYRDRSVPTIFPRPMSGMVGTLRFAHPTDLACYRSTPSNAGRPKITAAAISA